MIFTTSSVKSFDRMIKHWKRHCTYNWTSQIPDVENSTVHNCSMLRENFRCWLRNSLPNEVLKKYYSTQTLVNMTTRIIRTIQTNRNLGERSDTNTGHRNWLMKCDIIAEELPSAPNAPVRSRYVASPSKWAHHGYRTDTEGSVPRAGPAKGLVNKSLHRENSNGRD